MAYGMEVKNAMGKCTDFNTVLMCPPVNFNISEPINTIQKKWFDLRQGPDISEALREYNDFRSILNQQNIEVWELEPMKGCSYQVFVRDIGVIIPDGAIVGELKFDVRKPEKVAIKQILISRGINILYEFETPCTFEGGDFVFLDDSQVAIGLGERTNISSLPHLHRILKKTKIHQVKLKPGYFHLDAVFNTIYGHISIVFPSALPATFLDFLIASNFKIIEVSKREQETMATNVLPIGNNRVISASCNKDCNAAIRKIGLDVLEIEMNELLKGGGGPRCMTLPLYGGRR